MTPEELHRDRCGICMAPIEQGEETKPTPRGSGRAHLKCPDWPADPPMADSGKIMMPSTGGHMRIWGSGHTCDSKDGPHEGNCVCECGLPAPV